MHRLTTDIMGQACRIFLAQAYPGDDAAVPATKRRWLDLPLGIPFFDLLAGEQVLRDCSQIVRGKNEGVRGVLVRLGSAHYPNLKLKAQLVAGGKGVGTFISERPEGRCAQKSPAPFFAESDPASEWLFGVDTHDAFSAASFLPPPEHPDGPAWRKLQSANVALKVRIEAAWEQAGLLTFNGLLRRELQVAGPSYS